MTDRTHCTQVLVRISGTACALLLMSTPAAAAPAAPVTAAPAQAGTQVQTRPPALSQFAPRPSNRKRLDFSLWDDALKTSVIYGGPSLRERATRPQPWPGSRIVHGHTSGLRMEGNKVAYELLNDDYEDALAAYAADLESIANAYDIPSFPRDEQLAFWLNMHNALVISALAEAYPVARPSDIKGADGLAFHDTKRVTIRGVPLSLRDIRERIVYAHWNDPRVIYGFFHGDLGSPAIQTNAFRGDNVWIVLGYSATEFTNALRGVDRGGRKKLRVSKIYEEAAPWYFPAFGDDLRSHLREFVQEDTLDDIKTLDKPFQVARYETVIADLTAGDGDRKPISNFASYPGINGAPLGNGLIARTLSERGRKMNKLRRRGLHGTVVITDIKTDGERNAPTSAPPPRRGAD